MGCFELVITIGEPPDLMAEVQQLLAELADDHSRLVIIKRPDCCNRCRANDNARRVPPFGGGVHPHCKCFAVEVDDDGHEVGD